MLENLRVDQAELTLLFDGACPFCQREISFLRSRDKLRKIAFVDIDSPGYEPDLHGAITYRAAMGRIHAIDSSGKVLKDISVFREAYRLIGLGWIYVPTNWPLIGPTIEGIYWLWAKGRLPLTGRPRLDLLCKSREDLQ